MAATRLNSSEHFNNNISVYISFMLSQFCVSVMEWQIKRDQNVSFTKWNPLKSNHDTPSGDHEY